MFETMQSFLAFFCPTVALIILGILFEEKLIAFENRVLEIVLRHIRSKRNRKSNRA